MTDTEIAAIRRVLHRFDEDIIQDTLLALVKYPPTLRSAKLTSYAFQVAKRLQYRQHRHPALMVVHTLQGDGMPTKTGNTRQEPRDDEEEAVHYSTIESDGAVPPTQERRAIARQQLERLWAIDPVIITDCYNQTKNHRQHRSTQLRHKNRVKER